MPLLRLCDSVYLNCVYLLVIKPYILVYVKMKRRAQFQFHRLVSLLNKLVSILCHVESLLGNDREISIYTTAVTEQRLHKEEPFRNMKRIQEQWKRRFLRGSCRDFVSRAN
jgi:hypothetical protein